HQVARDGDAVGLAAFGQQPPAVGQQPAQGPFVAHGARGASQALEHGGPPCEADYKRAHAPRCHPGPPANTANPDCARAPERYSVRKTDMDCTFPMPALRETTPAAPLPADAEGLLKLAAQSMFDTFARTAMGMMVVDRNHRIIWISEGYKRFLPALGHE